MCKFCEDRTIENIPFRTNVVSPMFNALVVAKEDGGKELVVSADGKAYGLQIKYCPMCGAKLVDEAPSGSTVSKAISKFNEVRNAKPIVAAPHCRCDGNCATCNADAHVGGCQDCNMFR